MIFQSSTQKSTTLKAIFMKSKKDFFNPFIIRRLFLPPLFILVFWGIIFYIFAGSLFDHLYIFFRPDSLFSIRWLQWIEPFFDTLIKGAIFLFLTTIFLSLTLLSNLIICIFLTSSITNFIHKTYYPSKTLHNPSFFSSTFSFLKTYSIYFLSILIFAPFYFIPFLGVLIILTLNYWLFSKNLILDSAENIFTKKELQEFQKENSATIKIITIPLYGLSLIPFLNFFASIFGIIALVHLFFTLKN
ncbi:MAG: EI24 domain-containing protein [Helicobacter sp.]|nr:EI24 domain-containing protein [Helicobacter sp.]